MKEELNRKKSKKMKATFKDYEIDTGIDWGLTKEEKDAILDRAKLKEEILLRALEEHGIKIDIEKEKERRFKSMVVEIQEREAGKKVEVYYYNDGSIEGVKIVELPYFDISSFSLKGVKGALSDLIGGLSEEGAEEMREQIGELREEWQRFCECEAPLVRGYGDDEYCGLCQKRFIK